MSQMLAVFNTRNGKYGYAQKMDETNYTVIIDGKQKDISAKTFKNWYKEVSAEDVQAHTKTPAPEGIVIPETEAPAPIEETPAPELVQTELELAPDQQESLADNVIPFPNAEVNPEAPKSEETPDVEEIKLTALEIKLLNGMRNNEYNDAIEAATWSFTAIDYSGIPSKKARGVISSLIKKGLIGVTEGNKQAGDHETIWFTDKGVKLFDNADGEECSWGGKRLLKEIETSAPKNKKNDDKKTDAPTPAPSVKAEGNAKARNKAFFTNFLEELNKQVAGFTKAGARDRNYMSFPAGASGIKYKWYYTGDKLVCSLYFFGGSQQVTTQLFNKLQGFKSEIESKLSAYQLDWKAEENEIHRRVFTTFTGSDAELIKQGVKALIQFKEVFTPYIDIITQ